MPEHRYFIVNKPYNMVSQFISSHRVRLLTSIDFDFPNGTHAVGRLDINSEGLLILTTNKQVTKLLFESNTPHKRKYLVKVENQVSEDTLQKLRTGVTIRLKGGKDYVTAPCDAQLIEDEPIWVFEAGYKASIFKTYSWLMLSLTEGKYRQVRKMVSAVDHPCVRLIRMAIEELTLEGLQPGSVKEMEEQDFFQRLKIDLY